MAAMTSSSVTSVHGGLFPGIRHGPCVVVVDDVVEVDVVDDVVEVVDVVVKEEVVVVDVVLDDVVDDVVVLLQ